MTKVFISWSGRQSREVATELRQWLKTVIQALEPWSARTDIAPGVRWNHDVAENLEGSQVGILCVTRSNMDSAWLNFEAGALSKAVTKSRVIPYLIDIKPSDLTNDGPLPQFQAVIATQNGTLEMMKSINSSRTVPGAAEDLIIPVNLLEDAFRRSWPDLQEKLKSIVPDSQRATNASLLPAAPNQDRFDELLEGIRDIQRNVSHIRRNQYNPRGSRAELERLNRLSAAAAELPPVILTADSLKDLADLISGSSIEPQLSMWLREFLKQNLRAMQNRDAVNIRVFGENDGAFSLSYNTGPFAKPETGDEVPTGRGRDNRMK